jgi:hypothetical protein
MVPLVTEHQKLKRRKTEATKRKKEKRKSTAKSSRPRKGSDGPYKEFNPSSTVKGAKAYF